MDDSHDYELHTTPAEPPAEAPPPGRPIGIWIAVALLIGCAGGAFYALVRPSARTVAPAPPAAAATPAAPVSPGRTEEPITIPPLDDSDPVVSRLVRALSSSPAVAAWLTNDNLIRNFVDVVANIADGPTPARDLQTLRPSPPFEVIERDGNRVIDPRSYDRYVAVADAVASIDTAGAARLYTTLKPRIEDASRELGPAPGFDRTLERAVVALLHTPIVNGPVRVRPKGIGYAYADERLEQLTPAQKQLLRMGPRNMQIIQAKLRAIALAVGIPPADLPPA